MIQNVQKLIKKITRYAKQKNMSHNKREISQ